MPKQLAAASIVPCVRIVLGMSRSPVTRRELLPHEAPEAVFSVAIVDLSVQGPLFAPC